ncbi:hypothetical protein CYMTET_19089 [Cymbomonas tetramitiformis]|uniref:Histone deacetylase interacting domain-containing protein n=1 Tax=Cymbomonas tetramitiformis TaxID=36881 RepID=A0AAE0L5B4_9CHLO|nr:hypothetical protein CYMTET_19089 [Cymbomonas tetramitiformis]
MKRPRPEEAGTNANSAKRPAGGASGPQRGPPVNQKPQAQAVAPAAANTAGQPQQSGLTTMDALSYLRDVKDHFKYNKAVYDNFLDIMKEFKARRIVQADVIHQVKELFKGHDNLIIGFNTFVPKGAEIQLTAAERAEHAAERERQERLKAEQAQPAMKEVAAAQPASLPVEATKAGTAGGKRPVEYDQAFNYVNKIRTRFRYDERVYNQFLEILNMYRKGQKTISQVYAEVARLFKDHTDLLEEFTYFLPDNTAPTAGQPAASEALRKQMGINKRKSARRNEEMRKENEGLGEAHVEDRKPPKAANLGKELQFFEKVKTRLRNREAYQDLMKCLNIFNQEIISKSELQGLAYDIIGRFPDLMQGFNEFLLRCEAMDIDLGDSLRGRDAKISQRDLAKVKQVISARERFMSKPISELDLSACERCGPSYRLLPKNFPKPSCSHRNDLCMAVLNDNWVSVTSGSEDYSFKQMRKNQYEESLFRCEDDRFELDMIIETNESTLALLEPMAEKFGNLNPEEKASFRLSEDILSAVHLRCIERIYSDNGSDMRDLVMKNPVVAIPIVIQRLRQKDEEWRKCRDEMNKVWAEVYEKNYHKSLDHRSFYFKQTDKKALSTRGMQSEIREISEKRKREEEGMIIAAAANRRPLCPDLKFPFSDPQVHDDIYKILKLCMAEFSGGSSEQGAKLLSFWRTFIETFLGFPLREPDPVIEDEEEEDEDEEEKEKEKRSEPSEDDAAAELAKPIEKAEAMDTAEEGEMEMGDSEKRDEGVEALSGAEPEEPMTEREGGEETEGADKEEEDQNMELPAAEEEDDEMAYRGCKPLASVAEVEATSDSAAKIAPRVFYGHDQIYLLFRLHQHLYERIATAHKEASIVQARVDSEHTDPEVPPKNILNTFFVLLYTLLEGNLEPSRYEDECRALLGNNSYVLFTLDKLIFKLIKQLQQVQNDEMSMKLLLLYEYEKSRGSAFRDDVYYSNACVLLNEEICYRVESDADMNLSLQLMESSPDKSELSVGAMDSTFAEYLSAFLQSKSSREDKPGVFLKRSLQQPANKDEPLQDVHIYNGLECKISCNTSKVSYVLDTEDLFHKTRRGRRVKGEVSKKVVAKVERFHQWLEGFQASGGEKLKEKADQE